jgi:ubiquinone/menaquinone biosynthesis C-methylase UbiE
MQIAAMTPEEVMNLNYVQFISLLRETNRCPGGKQTIRKIIQNTFIGPASVVLEIGSNTGFTSLEIARTAKARVIGIDIEPDAVREAQRELQNDIPEVRDRIEFRVGSALALPFPDNEFDVVVAGGATSFMEEKQGALREYHRVLKPWGFLSVANLCYLKPPPESVVQQVSETLGVRIHPWSDSDWLRVYESCQIFESYFLERNILEAQSQQRINEYVDFFLQKDHLRELPSKTREAIRSRWQQTLTVFNENHRYLGFVLAVFRKRYLPEEPELFRLAQDRPK